MNMAISWSMLLSAFFGYSDPFLHSPSVSIVSSGIALVVVVLATVLLSGRAFAAANRKQAEEDNSPEETQAHYQALLDLSPLPIS